MRPITKTRTGALPNACVWLVLLLIAAGCRDEVRPLRLDDLDAAERLYVERFVVLERARVLALVDAETGAAALDSLAAAWGDSALAEARAALPDDSVRLAALHTLLAEILGAEEDSLTLAPVLRRLSAPVLDPPAPDAPPPDEDD